MDICMIIRTVAQGTIFVVRCRHYPMEVDWRESIPAESFDKKLGPNFLSPIGNHEEILVVNGKPSSSSTLGFII